LWRFWERRRADFTATHGADYRRVHIAPSRSLAVKASATLTGLDPGFPATPGSFTLYAIDGTHAVLIETDAEALTLGPIQTAP